MQGGRRRQWNAISCWHLRPLAGVGGKPPELHAVPGKAHRLRARRLCEREATPAALCKSTQGWCRPKLALHQ